MVLSNFLSIRVVKDLCPKGKLWTVVDEMAEKKKEESLPEVEVLIRGLLSQPGVEGFLVYNSVTGLPLRWTPAFVKANTSGASNAIPTSVMHHSGLMCELVKKSRATAQRLLGSADGELQLLRMHTGATEFIAAPHADVTLVISQRNHSAKMDPVLADISAVAPAAAVALEGGDAKKP